MADSVPAQSSAGAKPWIEFRREISPGCFRTYGNIYRQPLRIYLLGRWVWGKPND